MPVQIKLLLISLLLAILAFENVESQQEARERTFHHIKALLDHLGITDKIMKVVHFFIPADDGAEEATDEADHFKSPGLDLVMSEEMEAFKKGTAKRNLISMFRGEGGTAIISYNGKHVMVSNGRKTVCTQKPEIQKNQVVCHGRETIAPPDTCRPGKNIKQQNKKDHLCLVEENYVDVDDDEDLSYRRSKCPVGHLFAKEDLRRQCGTKVLTNKYASVVYVLDKLQLSHILLPSTNPFLGCKNKRAKICEFNVGISGPTIP